MKLHHLIAKAQAIMAKSRDPIHDLSHVTRVVAYTEQFSKKIGLTPEQTEAVVLAAWWHDAARTLTKKPSIVWMVFVDDIISALMLAWYTLRFGLFRSTAGLASRTILCKSLGTGAFFTKFCMGKKNRILIDILKDADALDVLNQDRVTILMTMVETSRIYHFGYKTTIRWFLTSTQLHMKTAAAREYAERILRTFIQWMKEKNIFEWHIYQFGREWVDMMMERSEVLLAHLTHLNKHTVPLATSA